VLAMGVAQHRSAELKEHLKQLSVSLRSLRTSKNKKSK